MKPTQLSLPLLLAAGLFIVPTATLAFTSGSTGALGALNPTVDTTLEMPADGIFHYTTINIPQNVTVRFKKNAANTPVVILATGDVTIAGTLTVAGGDGAPTGAGGDGNLGDDGVPGTGGPGGFDGGRGGAIGCLRGSAGLGPGGGHGGFLPQPWGWTCAGGYAGYVGGGGGSYASLGGAIGVEGGLAAPVYGSSLLIPLVGGSGGGGGLSGENFAGSGGGGGGGALLIASSGTLTVANTGSVLAHGGDGGGTAGDGRGAPGGGASGGAIRIVATRIAGNGTISANGGSHGSGRISSAFGGGTGRIRLESEQFARTNSTSPAFTRGDPSPVFIANFPTLKITSVAGQAVPANPTGNADIKLAADAPNPVTVVFTTTGVPVGNTVKLTVVPLAANAYSVVSPALSGSATSATASVSVNIPSGPSSLQATTTYTIVASLGDELSRFAQGERVEKVTLAATLGGESTATLVTVSGREVAVPLAMLAAYSLDGR